MISNKAFKAIAALDLEPIKTKLMHVASGEGWSRAKVNAMEIEYRRFLYLMQAFPEEQTAPTVDVDTFWHYHILDTVKYAADCEQAFGYFMHHFPYLGMQGEDDAGAEERGAERMCELYEATFGEAYIREEAYGAAAVASAYCIRTDPPKAPAQGASAAYCIRTDPPKAAAQGASAAYCIRTDPPKAPAQGASAAYCIRTDPPKAQVQGASAAYCIRTDPPKAPAQGASAAYCIRTDPPKAPAQGASAAYCIRSAPAKAPAHGASAAYCIRTDPPKVKAGTTFIGGRKAVASGARRSSGIALSTRASAGSAMQAA